MPGEDLHLSGCVRLEAHRVGPRSRPTWRCWIGSETRTLRAGMALVFPIRSGSARRFATPVEPPPLFLRVFVSPCETVSSAVSAPPPIHGRHWGL